MPIYDPDRQRRQPSPEPTDYPEGEVATQPFRIACANCLLEYLYLPGSRCPRCGADPIFAVPRRDFLPFPAAPEGFDPADRERDARARADELGRVLLYIGIALALLLGVLGVAFDGWTFWVAQTFLGYPSPILATWIQRIGVILMAAFAIRGIASALGWRSGEYWYRRFRI